MQLTRFEIQFYESREICIDIKCSLQSIVATFYDESHYTTVGKFVPTLGTKEELVSSVSQSMAGGIFVPTPATMGFIVKDDSSFVVKVEEAEISA